MRSLTSQRPSIYGTGFLALDIVRSASQRTSISAYAGGTCGNVLAILAYLGWDAYPIARLNGDAASRTVQADLHRIGVKLDFATCKPGASTPIVVQSIQRTTKGPLTHAFASACAQCNSRLPRYEPVPVRAAARIAARMRKPAVFFIDRVSPAGFELAKTAAMRGALVYFEPSEIGDAELFNRILGVTHVVKYSEDRLRSLGPAERSVVMEIKTLGAHGLMYRSRLGGDAGWLHLPSVRAGTLVDACGAGDWCSAGFIALIGAAGLDGLFAADETEVVAALRYGQRLAAWNCGFEGARGGMYALTRPEFSDEIAEEGVLWPTSREEPRALQVLQVDGVPCPSCRALPG